MQKLKHIILAGLMVVGVSLVAVPAGAVTINDAKTETCKGTGGAVTSGKCGGGSSVAGIFRTVANILLFLVGAIAVIMIIVGGFRFVTANGDSTQITAARNTVLYAIVGIVVAFLAFAAVNFVSSQLEQGSTAERRDSRASSACAGLADADRQAGIACRQGFRTGYDGGGKATCSTYTGPYKTACEQGFEVGKQVKAE